MDIKSNGGTQGFSSASRIPSLGAREVHYREDPLPLFAAQSFVDSVIEHRNEDPETESRLPGLGQRALF